MLHEETTARLCKRCKGPVEAHRPTAEHCCDCANIIYMCANRNQPRGPNDYFEDGLGE